jgi:hypothetical protein
MPKTLPGPPSLKLRRAKVVAPIAIGVVDWNLKKVQLSLRDEFENSKIA